MQAAFLGLSLCDFERVLARMPGVRRTRLIRPAPAVGDGAARSEAPGSDAAAVVHVEYDPRLIQYDVLLALFFEHYDLTRATDPRGTTGTETFAPDGRSTIYYYDDDQRVRASAAKIRLDRSGRFGMPTPTQILPAPEMFPGDLQKTRSKRASLSDRPAAAGKGYQAGAGCDMGMSTPTFDS